MLYFRTKKDAKTKARYIETNLKGKPLLTTPQLNKGTAFTESEREAFGLVGKLPIKVETLEEQLYRAFRQYEKYKDPMQKRIYLSLLHDQNQTLFYALVSRYLEAMTPIIYTPIVGNSVQQFSHDFRQPRGLYLSYPNRGRLGKLLSNRSNPEVDVIVVTDGEAILGIGDQGVGGMDIPIAKLMVYTLWGGLSPYRTLPVCLDVGTNNETLLQDPLYLGLPHPRIDGAAYDAFIEEFVEGVQKSFPYVFLHWEDFGREHARDNLERYRNHLPSFNDDMQGTAVVCMAAWLASMRISKRTLQDQRIVIFGAGTAGTGIADHLVHGMKQLGLSEQEAVSRIYLVDRQGLLHDGLQDVTPGQKLYARLQKTVSAWARDASSGIGLETVIREVKPTVLIGCSAKAGAFNESVLRALMEGCGEPVIFPLSNPPERCEATAEALVQGTDGKAIIATGSPFESVVFRGKTYPIAQCNNALAFPGIGLGVLAVRARTVSDGMLWAATQALANAAPGLTDDSRLVLPMLTQSAESLAPLVAQAVALAAIQEGHADAKASDVPFLIAQQRWRPHYLPYRFGRRKKNKILKG